MEFKDQIEGIAKEVKADVQKVEAKATEVAAEVKELSELNSKLQAQVDALEAKANRAGRGGEAEEKAPFMAVIEAKAAELKNRSRNQTLEIQLDQKAAADMLSGAANQLRSTTPQMLPYVATLTSVEDVVAGGSIGGDLLTYVQESGFEGAPGMTGEGALKPKVSISLETKQAGVKKIAAHFKISEETTKDYPQFVSYLKARVAGELKDVKGAQMLYGDGTSNNLQGIYPIASAFNAGGKKIANAQKIDVLRLAIAQVRKAKFKATAILMNPSDVAEMELTKDANGNYLLPTVLTGSLPNVGRVQIIEIDAIEEGTFLVGAFDKGAQYLTREGLTIRVYDQNEDDAIHNMVTVVVEERGVQAVYRPESFVKGTFATAITSLLAA